MDATAPAPVGGTSSSRDTPARLANHHLDEPQAIDCQPGIHEYGGGPVPGAIRLRWEPPMTAANTRKPRPVPALRAGAWAVGATPERVVICSCGTGCEAADAFPTSHHLPGCPRVRPYEGSFSDWISRPEHTAVTGPDPW